MIEKDCIIGAGSEVGSARFFILGHHEWRFDSLAGLGYCGAIGGG